MNQSLVTALILLFAGAHSPGPAHLVEAFSRSTPSGRRSAFRNSCRDREHNQQCLHVGRNKDPFASTNANSFSSTYCKHSYNAPSHQPITHTKSLASANRDLEVTVNGEDDEGYESEERQIAKQGFYIRRGLFKDLRCVADLMMDAFYDEKSIMFHYHRMLELDRVQNNFPYDSSKHEYYVACAPDGKVIGFVDIDARPSARKDAPTRPYLSDLAVSSEWRRKGIASRLVEQCEARARSMGKAKCISELSKRMMPLCKCIAKIWLMKRDSIPSLASRTQRFCCAVICKSD